MGHFKSHYLDELVEVLRKAGRDRRLLADFLDDLLTPAERREIALRWQIVRQLHRKVPHWEVAGNLKVAIATVTRGARTLLNPTGGFRQALRLLKQR
jgi:TrpR family trp operon transcriptional repressor